MRYYKSDDLWKFFEYTKGLSYKTKPYHSVDDNNIWAPIHGSFNNDIFEPTLVDNKQCYYKAQGGVKGFDVIQPDHPAYPSLMQRLVMPFPRKTPHTFFHEGV